MSDQEQNNESGFMLPEGVEDAIPTTEPKLTQLDPASRAIILNTIYNYGYIKDPETGAVSKVIESVEYPELEKALSYAGSHLNSVMYYTWSHGMAELLFWEGLFYDPLSLYHDDDPEALRVLDALNLMLRRSIKGGSIGGSHQDYNIKMAGGHRIYEVKKNEQQQ